jgi:hypothetical protein
MINFVERIVGRVEYNSNMLDINGITASAFKLIFIQLFLPTNTIVKVEISI